MSSSKLTCGKCRRWWPRRQRPLGIPSPAQIRWPATKIFYIFLKILQKLIWQKIVLQLFDLFETASSRLCFAVHPVELSLYDGAADGEALPGLQLGRQREQALVLHVELVVQLGQHQDLRPPVLRVRRPVLQPVCHKQRVSRDFILKGNFHRVINFRRRQSEYNQERTEKTGNKKASLFSQEA